MTDEASEDTPCIVCGFVQGYHGPRCPRHPSMLAAAQAEQDSFFALCEKLRALGATKVSAGAYTAEFARDAPYTAPANVTVVPISTGAREHAAKLAKEKANYAMYEGEKLTEEDKVRRAGYADLRGLVTGEGG